jgi:hypothetical protein
LAPSPTPDRSIHRRPHFHLTLDLATRLRGPGAPVARFCALNWRRVVALALNLIAWVAIVAFCANRLLRH